MGRRNVDAGNPHPRQACGCEHVDHYRGGSGHPYLRAEATGKRALHVGYVCDECAETHMAEYLLKEVAR